MYYTHERKYKWEKEINLLNSKVKKKYKEGHITENEKDKKLDFEGNNGQWKESGRGPRRITLLILDFKFCGR